MDAETILNHLALSAGTTRGESAIWADDISPAPPSGMMPNPDFCEAFADRDGNRTGVRKSYVTVPPKFVPLDHRLIWSVFRGYAERGVEMLEQLAKMGKMIHELRGLAGLDPRAENFIGYAEIKRLGMLELAGLWEPASIGDHTQPGSPDPQLRDGPNPPNIIGEPND